MTKPPMEDWVYLAHLVEGTGDDAHYRRQLPNGQWESWWALGGQWIECEQP